MRNGLRCAGKSTVYEQSDDTTDSMFSTGFARRLSKRLKHLPLNTDIPEGPRPIPNMTARPRTATTKSATTFDKPMMMVHKEVSPPPDSAYSSLKEKDSPSNKPLSDTLTRRESVLAPLPFEHRPPPEPEISPPYGTGKGGVAASVRSLTSSKSRAMSVRNMFRNKWRKEKVLSA